MEDFLDCVDSYPTLRKIRSFVEDYVFRIQTVDYMSQCCYLVGLVCIVSFGVNISIPSLYSDPNSVFIAQCLGFFCAFQVLLNWLCVKLVDSKYQPFIHGVKPDDIDIGYNFRPYPSADENQNGGLPGRQNSFTTTVEIHMEDPETAKGPTQTNDTTENGDTPKEKKGPYFAWQQCMECNRPRPPRAHHCTDCGKCVLKRDHHCFFAGNCVGYRNMRHFSMFVFYSAMSCVFASVHALPHYYYYIYPETRIVDLFVPLGFLRALFGFIQWSDILTIMLGWLLCSFLIISRTYLFLVVRLILSGQTSFEMDRKHVIIDTRSRTQKLHAVFGHYWALNFILPLHFVFHPIEEPLTWPTIIAK